ncbi:hypothetical protein AMS68_004889 [Peltaster fructicola]|uniref:DNA damage-binding protein 1 n=1 Tax=Peltaster fructicola TaxID=286661 RepID=A0A6H0XX72_9PEZI|nr:hypothetical protein AMS68_004889 [Peltaster fructicola]
MAYIAPIHRPSSVRHAIRLDFLAPESEDLILAKANVLEIWSPNAQVPEQLSLQHTKSLYGRVTLLQRLRPATSATDHVFVGTDRHHYFTLSWDADRKELRTEKSYVDIAEKAARDSQTGDRVHIDPTNRFLTLECYEGVVNVLPISQAAKGKRRAADNETGELGDPIPVRTPELFVRSTCFVHQQLKSANPQFAILEEDPQQNLHIKIRELEFTPALRPQEEPATAELEKYQDVQGQIEPGASHLIPLPAPTYGFFVIGETSIAYVDDVYKVRRTKPLRDSTVFVSWCAIDENRYALADDYGKLYLLFVQHNDNGDYEDHQIDVLGVTSRASTLVYLDGGRIFVGSNQGDSQIIQIIPQGLQVVQTFANVAPILDFTVMDMGNRSAEGVVNEFSSGQARIVTGSGAFKDGSLRSVRSGVGLEDLGSIGNMGAPISAMFGLKSDPTHHYMDTLLVSFVDHTRVFYFSAEGQVEEHDEFKGFNLTEGTLSAGCLENGRAIQITSSGIVVTTGDGNVVTDRWHWECPGGTTISSAQIDATLVLLSLQGSALVLLDIEHGITQRARRDFSADEQVSCLALDRNLLPDLCAVGFWKAGKVSLLNLHDLQTHASEVVSESEIAVVPRALVLAQIFHDRPATLFVGLADGNVVTYSIDTNLASAFDGRKTMVLGTQEPHFTALSRGDGSQNVFAICEHPSLVYGAEGRMVYSAVTADDATSICSFDCEAYPGSIAIATTQSGELKLAFVDEERTTHVETLPVNETVRRIAYSPSLKAFGLGTISRTLSAGVEEVVSRFKLVDEVVFQELHTYTLDDDELIESVMRCELDDGSKHPAERFVVGTAYLDDEGKEGVRGRILIFEVTTDRQLRVVLDHPLKGACRCLAVCDGKIVAALIKTVVIFSLDYDTPSQPTLQKRAAYRTSTAPIDVTVTGNTIAVSDLMKSLSLIEYKAGQLGANDTLLEIGRHQETLWSTAVANVADNTYLQSDAEGNLVVLQHELGSYSEEARRRLRVTSEMLLGEMVNRIRRIDVQPSPGAVIIPRAFIATVEGSIYMFALIAPGRQDLLMRMQNKMAEIVSAPGSVPFAKYRGFRSSVRDMGSEGPMRFVDGTLLERFSDCDEATQLEVEDSLMTRASAEFEACCLSKQVLVALARTSSWNLGRYIKDLLAVGRVCPERRDKKIVKGLYSSSEDLPTIG